MQEGSGVTNLQTQLNYLDSFKSYCKSSDLGFLSSGGWGRWVGYLGGSAIVYMSSGMFRGKESSNRIKLSRLVQDLLNFGVLGSLQVWGGGSCMGGMGGSPHTCTCMHTHTCTHAHLYIYRNCKWPLTWRHPCLACLTCMCMCACVCVYACACMHPYNTHTHPHTYLHLHPPIHHSPGGGPQNHLKFNNTSTYQDISIPLKEFEIYEEFPTHGWLCGLVGGWVVWWVDGWDQVKSLKI